MIVTAVGTGIDRTGDLRGSLSGVMSRSTTCVEVSVLLHQSDQRSAPGNERIVVVNIFTVHHHQRSYGERLTVIDG
jgi:hypothetical protein